MYLKRQQSIIVGHLKIQMKKIVKLQIWHKNVASNVLLKGKGQSWVTSITQQVHWCKSMSDNQTASPWHPPGQKSFGQRW